MANRTLAQTRAPGFLTPGLHAHLTVKHEHKIRRLIFLRIRDRRRLRFDLESAG
jgi:hypothetical protein